MDSFSVVASRGRWRAARVSLCLNFTSRQSWLAVKRRQGMANRHVIGGDVIDETNPLPVSVSTAISVGDVEIGAVELKDGTTDTRGKVGPGSGLVTADNAVAVADPTVGLLVGALTE